MTRSSMLEEALATPGRVADQLAHDGDAYAAVAARLERDPTCSLLTLARGSADHAAQHFAYLAMARLGRLVTSLPMSLLTLYASPLPGPSIASIALSQSGQSPDLVEPTAALRAAGACTVAIVHDAASPLARAAEYLLPLHAGAETSIAATQGCIAQFVAGARLVAAMRRDPAFDAALATLPRALERATTSPWEAAAEQLAGMQQLYVVGRGPGLALAQEAALKFKEVCGIQAEAFSTAEVQHGPMALVGEGWPILVLALRGPTQAGSIELAARLAARQARVLLAAPAGTPAVPGATAVTLATTAHEDLDAIAALQTIYPMVEALAWARGRDPDRPPFLSKVTRTQ